MFDMPRELLIRCKLELVMNLFGHSVLQHGERLYFDVCDLRFLESGWKRRMKERRVMK